MWILYMTELIPYHICDSMLDLTDIEGDYLIYIQLNNRLGAICVEIEGDSPRPLLFVSLSHC